MENTMNVISDFENDTLSLSDLPLHHRQQQTQSKVSVSDDQDQTTQDFFEFPTSPSLSCSSKIVRLPPDNIIFCGKVIPCKKTQEPSNVVLVDNSDQRNLNKNKVAINSSSAVEPSSPPKSLMPNSVSSNSRKHKVLIGLLPAKISTKMELSNIKERQSRREPTPMFPAMADDKTPVNGGDRQKGDWGRRGALFCKSELQSRRLAKASFGCFPRARPCMEH